jgi:Tfp pilus assembly protein PilF
MHWKAEQIFEQAILCVRGRDYDRALAYLVQAIGEDENLVEAWTLRGNILIAQERHFEALLHYDRALSIRPQAFDAWNNRGQALGCLGKWDEAELSFKRSISLMNTREPHLGLANMFCTLMRLEDAVEEYRKVVAMDDVFDHEAHFNLGITLLGLGQWKEGFQQYWHRHLNEDFQTAARRNYPEWKGEPLEGKTILLYPEQGYGDEIMIARFAARMSLDNPHTTVILEARAPFARLVRTMHRKKIVVRGDPYPDGIDYSCAMMDLPLRLGMEPASVPRPQSYLKVPDGILRCRFAEMLSDEIPSGFNVGLCWTSGRHLSAATTARQMKSIPIHKLAGLAIQGVNLISLQKPAEPTPPEMRVYDWTDELHDLADTAALISALDLVITVDTAVAHLAGALGMPVWNFVRFSGYWPWLAPGNDPEHSIWYPSMRLLRQTALNDWAGPIATAERDLRALVAQKEAAE